MPLKLIPPRAGKSPNWTIRGTHHGVAVDKTSGASNRADAARILAKVKSEIDSGVFAVKGERTFADAAEQYMIATDNMRFVMPVAEHFAHKPLSQIDSRAIDEAAMALYPNASPATRNRQVYTVVSAILRHAGVTIAMKRPKGSAGARRVAYLEPKQAFALIKAATAHDARFGALLIFRLYTGARLNEALSLTWADVDLPEARALIYQTKTEGARTAFLPVQVVAALGPLHAREGARGQACEGWQESSSRIWADEVRAHLHMAASRCGRRWRAYPRPRGLSPIPPHMGDVDAPLRRHGYGGLSRDRRVEISRQRLGL
jgi:integrase